MTENAVYVGKYGEIFTPDSVGEVKIVDREGGVEYIKAEDLVKAGIFTKRDLRPEKATKAQLVEYIKDTGQSSDFAEWLVEFEGDE